MTDPISFPPGKLPVEILERLIRTYTSSIHGVVVGASIGEDAAAIDFGEKYLLAKTDPITFVAEDIGTYAIFVNSNDIAAMGGRPLWFLATVLLPEKGATPELVERIFEQLSSACRRIDVAFCGGHTEITVGIDRPIVIGTMLGEVEKNRLITTGGARPGDDILLTKAIAIEGTSIIAREKGEELARLFGEEILHRCRNLAEKPGISVLEDARIAMRNGRVHSMHDPTEGGLANALHEVAAAADVGLVVDEDRIPILDECRVLCRHYGLDPLGLIASGSLLIMVEPSDSGKIMRSLEEAGVPAAKIGRITRKERGVKSRSEGRIKDLPRFARDEIAKILELPKDSCKLYTVYKSSTRQPALGFRQSRGSLTENIPSGVPECKGGVMPLKMESGLHVGKVVEITAASTRSFEDAIAVGIDRASKTLKNVQGAWVKEQKVKVKDGKIAQYRVDLMVTFLLED